MNSMKVRYPFHHWMGCLPLPSEDNEAVFVSKPRSPFYPQKMLSVLRFFSHILLIVLFGHDPINGEAKYIITSPQNSDLVDLVGLKGRTWFEPHHKVPCLLLHHDLGQAMIEAYPWCALFEYVQVFDHGSSTFRPGQ